MKSRIGKRGTVLLAVIVLAATAVAGGALATVAARHTATGTAAAKTTKIVVTETDYAIALSKSSSVPVGTVKFVVHNTSATAHKFGVKGKGVNKLISGLIQPGKTKTLTVVLKKGTYTVSCKIHVSLGMKATLVVGGAGATTTGTTTGTTTTNSTYTWG